MKCPPSPTKREPSAASRYQLLASMPPGVDEVADRQRPAATTKAIGQLIDQGCEPAVEPDHEPVVPGALHRVHDLPDLRLVERQRLLHEHGLARTRARDRRSSAWEWCRVTTNTASSAGSERTSSAWVLTCSKPNLRWALTADSERVVATEASSTPSWAARWGSSIEVA